MCLLQHIFLSYIIVHRWQKKEYIENVNKSALKANIFGTKGIIIFIFDAGASRSCTLHKGGLIGF